MSTSWHTEYLNALAARDSIEQTSKEVYDAYSKLASRSTTTAQTAIVTQPVQPPTPVTRVGSWSRATTPTVSSPGRWQEELQEAQTRRAELESKFTAVTAELEALKTRLRAEERRAGELSSENVGLGVKLRDRIEELNAKAKLVQDVHDEAVALNLQLNISEETNAKLKKENKDLIDRWMARVGKEADAMNDASKF